MVCLVTGVYYIYNESGTLIYIGKSINIRKRLNQHFTGITNSAKVKHEKRTKTPTTFCRL
jgi:excinuclease UvrABC nuclease subunit